MSTPEFFATEFLLRVETGFQGVDPTPYEHDPRVAKIGRAVRAAGVQEVDILGGGSFGLAARVIGRRVAKLTSDETEVEAGSLLVGKDLPHVVRMYGSWFVRGTRVTHWETGHETRVGLLLMEKLAPLDTKVQGGDIRHAWKSVRQAFGAYPEALAQMPRERARERLHDASVTLERELRSIAKGPSDDSPIAKDIADALHELRDLGIYGIDVHPGNIGFSSAELTFKLFDVGASSSPRTTEPGQLPPETTIELAKTAPQRGSRMPGMVEEGVKVEEIGEEVAEEAAEDRRGRRKTIRIDRLIVGREALAQALWDVGAGRTSRTKAPLDVWYKPESGGQPVDGYLLTDGHHRLVEQLLRGTAPFEWNEVEVRQVGSGYNDYWRTPAPEERFVFTKTRYGGLEALADLEILHDEAEKLGVPRAYEAAEDRRFLDYSYDYRDFDVFIVPVQDTDGSVTWDAKVSSRKWAPSWTTPHAVAFNAATDDAARADAEAFVNEFLAPLLRQREEREDESWGWTKSASEAAALTPEQLAALPDGEIERLPIETLDRAAFGFTSGSVVDIPVNDVEIRYTSDYDAAWGQLHADRRKVRSYLRSAHREPVEVSLRHGRFYLEDGHHRYVATKLSGESTIRAVVQIKDNPIVELRRKYGGAAEEAPRPRDLTQQITVEALVTKYMAILGLTVRPRIEIHQNVGSRWLGRCIWTTRDPSTSTIELQRSILGDERTLERIIAHEMVHHRDFMNLSEQDLALLKVGIKPDGHGESFMQGAAIINEAMGPDFVTKTSDQSYVQANTKPFFVLIGYYAKDRLGYKWAARLNDEAKWVIDEEVAKGARLITTTDETWTHGRAKINRMLGWNIPSSPERRDALQALYDAAGPQESVAQEVVVREAGEAAEALPPGVRTERGYPYVSPLNVTEEQIRSVVNNKEVGLLLVRARDFLTLTLEDFDHDVAEARATGMYNGRAVATIEQYNAGLPEYGPPRIMPLLSVRLSDKMGKVTGHEGRHRALALYMQDPEALMWVAFALRDARGEARIPAGYASRYYGPGYIKDPVTLSDVPEKLRAQFNNRIVALARFDAIDPYSESTSGMAEEDLRLIKGDSADLFDQIREGSFVTIVDADGYRVSGTAETTAPDGSWWIRVPSEMGNPSMRMRATRDNVVSVGRRPELHVVHEDASTSFFHASASVLPVGTFLRGDYGEGYEWRKRAPASLLLEARRPAGVVSRTSAVFMTTSSRTLAKAGGDVEHVYKVEPVGQVSGPFDGGWHSEISRQWLKRGGDLADDLSVLPRFQKMADAYWAGEKCKGELCGGTWEMLTPEARIVKVLR